MYEKSATKSWFCRVSAIFYGCVHGWKKPVSETIAPLRHAYDVGIECGDIEFAMVSAQMILLNQFDHASVTALDREMESFMDRMKFYGQGQFMISWIHIPAVNDNLTDIFYPVDRNQPSGKNEIPF